VFSGPAYNTVKGWVHPELKPRYDQGVEAQLGTALADPLKTLGDGIIRLAERYSASDRQNVNGSIVKRTVDEEHGTVEIDLVPNPNGAFSAAATVVAEVIPGTEEPNPNKIDYAQIEWRLNDPTTPGEENIILGRPGWGIDYYATDLTGVFSSRGFDNGWMAYESYGSTTAPQATLDASTFNGDPVGAISAAQQIAASGRAKAAVQVLDNNIG